MITALAPPSTWGLTLCLAHPNGSSNSPRLRVAAFEPAQGPSSKTGPFGVKRPTKGFEGKVYVYCDPVQAVRSVLRSLQKQASERPGSNWGLGEGKGRSWSVSPKAWGCRASSLDGSTHSPGLLLKAWTLNSEPDTFRSPETDSWNLAVCRGGR